MPLYQIITDMMDIPLETKKDEEQIRELIEKWALAVRNQDIEAILAHHSSNIVMYDVPPPFQSIGIEEYRKTWDTFFAFTKPGVFDINQLHIVTDKNVAFCFAAMQCADISNTVEYPEINFRLTVGLQKLNNQWTVIHEHHSIPSE